MARKNAATVAPKSTEMVLWAPVQKVQVHFISTNAGAVYRTRNGNAVFGMMSALIAQGFRVSSGSVYLPENIA